VQAQGVAPWEARLWSRSFSRVFQNEYQLLDPILQEVCREAQHDGDADPALAVEVYLDMMLTDDESLGHKKGGDPIA